MNKIEQQVRSASQNWIAAFNRGQIDKIAAGYCHDAEMRVRLLAPEATQFNGRSNIQQFWADFMKQSPSGLVYTNINIRVIDEQHAVLSADWSMNIVSGFITEELWVKDDKANWQIKRDNFTVLSQHQKAKRAALILVDFQQDYLPSGRMPLPNMLCATIQAQQLLNYWRQTKQPVIHIQHIFAEEDAPFFSPTEEGKQIHSSLSPTEGEIHLIKHEVNAFNQAGLSQVLVKEGITDLVVIGAMTHLCVSSIVRQAADQGYPCTVIRDACASPNETIDEVSEAILAFGYANISSCAPYLAKLAAL